MTSFGAQLSFLAAADSTACLEAGLTGTFRCIIERWCSEEALRVDGFVGSARKWRWQILRRASLHDL